MKIIAIIPARGGSKGIPGKNRKMLGGKPLLAYSIESAMQSKLLDAVMVSTEDDEIAHIASCYGLPVPFMRPVELAQDTSPTIEVIKHVVETYGRKNIHFDAVMILEPTSPFRHADEIDDCIRIFSKGNADSLITVKKVPDEFNPHWVYERDENSLLIKAINDEAVISRRQNLPMTFARDGSVYITRTEVLLEKNSLYGDLIAYKLRSNPDHINIDSMIDWDRAEKTIEGIVN